MKVSVSWLSKYVDLSGIEIDDLVDKLTLAGLEIEEVINQKEIYENFVVGYVKEKKSHPNADKLAMCVVSDGSETYDVICGAPNVDKDQKVVFAKVGAVIPEGEFKISKAKIRGEYSYGMICSEKELGISDNHEGIMVLDSKMKEGTPLSEALGMNDVILDIAITPNRPDAFSHVGIARDIAALYKRKLKIPKIELKEDKQKSSELASVEIIDPEKCPRYVGKVVTDVTVKESPDWLKKHLTSIGLRPINNIVDVTNFVLQEIGQPLHGFDLDKLNDKRIVVKRAEAKEKFVTLDSKERKMEESDLMICDGKTSVAIAGVMGGENSEVTGSTKNILIESAFFNASSVRKTSKRLGLSTDASYRFERGTDPDVVIWAAQRAAQLIAETSGGKVAAGEIDAYPNKIKKKTVSVRYSRINKIMGFDIPEKDVQSILTSLDFEIKKKEDDKVTVEIPLRRNDSEREIDLIEEVARIYGYDKIPSVEKISIALEKRIDESAFNDDVRDTLTSLGFFEIVTNSLVNEKISKTYGNPVNVINPQTTEMTHLRPSLIPGALMTVSRNIKVREKNLMLFEIGHTFEKTSNKKIKSFDDFTENESIILLLTGKDIESEWYGEDRNYDFYDLKGYVDAFLNKLFPEAKLDTEISTDSDDKFEYAMIKKSGKSVIGKGGKLKQNLLDEMDINQDVFLFEFYSDTMNGISAGKQKFDDLLKYPKVIRDFAFVLDNSIDFESVIDVIKKGSTKLLHNIKLFDIFQSESLGKDKRSLAFQLEYYDENRTLTEEEVDKDFRNAINAVQTKLNGKLRGE